MALSPAASYRTRIITRIASVLLAIGITVMFPHHLAALAYYALALGHFLLAFMYQRDAGKWSAKKLIAAGVFFLVVAIAWNIYYMLGFFITSLAFVIHMMLDETHLFGEKPSRVRTLESLPFIVLWGVLSLYIGFGIDAFLAGYLIAGMLVAGRMLTHSAKRARLDVLSAVLLAWGALTAVGCAVIQAYGIMVPATLWFFGIANIHFFLWYGDYYFRVASDAAKKKTYIRRALLTNVGTFAVAGLYGFGAAPMFVLFFGQGYVNAWSLLHITSSLRLSTLRQSVTS